MFRRFSAARQNEAVWQNPLVEGRAMQLTPAEVARFYAIWKPLILFVNRRLRLAPDMLRPDFEGPWDVRQVKTIRDAMWADDSLREAFVAENPAGLSPADLALLGSWDCRKAGKFFVVKHLKKYSVFVGAESEVYGVLGLASPLDEVVPFTPCYVAAVLLPFDGRIIYDSVMAPYHITFGPGYRRSVEEAYQDAKERGAIITSLAPAGPADPEDERQSARATDARVLDAFRKHLLVSGLSPRVAERDAAGVAAFAEEHLLLRPQARSLRDFGPDDVRAYAAEVEATGGRHKDVLLGLKRFLRFLRDTGRMDYEAAEEALGALKGRQLGGTQE
jgi:hypothetical protein